MYALAILYLHQSNRVRIKPSNSDTVHFLDCFIGITMAMISIHTISVTESTQGQGGIVSCKRLPSPH